MNEVSTVMVRAMLRLTTDAGIDLAPIVAGLSFDQRSVQHVRRVSWDDYCVVIDRLAAAVGGGDRLADLAAAGYHDAIPAEARVLLRSLVSPKLLYRVIFTILNPPAFPAVEFEYRELSDDRVRIAGRIRPASRGCIAFHQGNVGAIRGVPAHIGLPSSEIEVEELNERNVVVTVHVPESQTLVARARRKSLGSVRDAALRLLMQFSDEARDRGVSLSTLLDSKPRSVDPEVLSRVQVAEKVLALTRRQSEVLAFLVRGLSNKEIGIALGCAENTVELHVTQLLRKASVDSRVRLVAQFWTDQLRTGLR